MDKMEPYVEKWHTYLNEGKLMGVKCKECGEIQCPPFPACQNCSGTSMEWVELSGEAELRSFAYSPTGIPPYTTEPVMVAYVKFKEGPDFASWLLDTKADDQPELLKRMPFKVKTEIKQISEEPKVSYPVFRIME